MLATFTVNVDYDTNSWVDTDEIITLREAIERANTTSPGPDTINFSTDPMDDLDGGTITLGLNQSGIGLGCTSSNGAELNVTESLTIDASALPNGITIDASNSRANSTTMGDGIDNDNPSLQLFRNKMKNS